MTQIPLHSHSHSVTDYHPVKLWEPENGGEKIVCGCVSRCIDYTSFGMTIPGKSWTAGGTGYRWGFQAQESDNELFGEGNASFFKYRISDNRIGRFFAVDPLASKYPYLTPYQFSSNQPIHAIELEGLESRYEFSMHRASMAVAGGDASASDRLANSTMAITKKVTSDAIDGVAYFASSTSHGPIAFGFTWDNGFQPELSYFYNPTLENSFRYFGGGLTAASAVSTSIIGFRHISRSFSKSVNMKPPIMFESNGIVNSFEDGYKIINRPRAPKGGYTEVLLDGTEFHWKGGQYLPWRLAPSPVIQNCARSSYSFNYAVEPTLGFGNSVFSFSRMKPATALLSGIAYVSLNEIYNYGEYQKKANAIQTARSALSNGTSQAQDTESSTEDIQ